MAVRSAVARGRPGVGGVPGTPRLRLPGVRPVYAAVLESAGDLVGCSSAFEAELGWTAIWRSLCEGAPARADLEQVLLDLVDVAEGAGTTAGLVLLRVMAAVAPAAATGAAGAAAGRVAHRVDAGLPAWLDQVGAVVPGRCLRVVSDPFGEVAHVVCGFAYEGGQDPHVVVVTVDRACRGALMAARMGAGMVIEEMAAAVGGADGPVPEVLDVEVAAGIVRQAVQARSDGSGLPLTTWPEPDVTTHTVLPMLVQRVMAMVPAGTPDRPGAAAGDDVSPLERARDWSASRRAALAQEFLDAHRGDLGEVTFARLVTERLIDLSLDVLGWAPDRIGPRSAARLLLDVVPQGLLLPEAVLGDLEVVAARWCRWVADRTGRDLSLTAAGRADLQDVLDRAVGQLAGRVRDRKVTPRYPYVADVPPDRAAAQALREVLHRRVVAVPLPGRRGDGDVELPASALQLAAGRTHVDDLDAADPLHRGAIEAIGLIADHGDEATIPSRGGVVNQLWTDDPPEAWQAVRRMLDRGLDRRQAMERLARLWRRHAPDDETLASGTVPPGPAGDAYRAALGALAPD